jgi:hypothetical protein
MTVSLLQEAINSIPRYDSKAATQILTADGFMKFAMGKKLSLKDFKPAHLAKLKKQIKSW